MALLSDDSSGLVPLADYTAPDEPTVDMLQRLWQRASRIIPTDAARRAAGKESLQRASPDRVADLTDQPDYTCLFDELDRVSTAWLAEDIDARLPLVIVTSPCDPDQCLESWARARGHAVVSPPGRSTLSILDNESVSELVAQGREGSMDGLRVIPRLEDWFLRLRGGIEPVRALLIALSLRAHGPCLIGCNSWAWRYLERVAGADVLLPAPMTFRPFDADRLADWFAEMATKDAPQNTTFRESSSGHDVFAKNEEGALQSDFLQYLAARSRGVPWIAWALWRRSLRTRRDSDGESAERRDTANSNSSRIADDDKATIWLVKPEEHVLPDAHERRSRLILHALLLHGSLTAEELTSVLPLSDDTVLVPALVSAGLVELSSGQYRCAVTAYASVFESLATAGFSTPPV